jgi:hypothetical protein
MPTFPSYATILAEGYKEQREPGFQRTEMESGPPKQARVKFRPMVARPVRILLDTLADYDDFTAWFRDDLKEGALWFDLVDPVRGVPVQARFTEGLDAAPDVQDGSRWIVASKMETWG